MKLLQRIISGLLLLAVHTGNTRAEGVVPPSPALERTSEVQNALADDLTLMRQELLASRGPAYVAATERITAAKENAAKGIHTPNDPQGPRDVELELVHFYSEQSSKPAERQLGLRIGMTVFDSVAEVKHFLKSYPEGSSVTWAPGCVRWGGEPLEGEELAEFTKFCEAEKLVFIVVPSG